MIIAPNPLLVLIKYSVFFLIAGAVFYGIFSATSHSGSFGTSDKTEHLLAFGVLSLYGLLILPKRLLWLFVTAVLVLAVGSEFIQAWLLPNRQYALLDMLANVSGLAIALLIWWLNVRWTRRKNDAG